MDKERARRLFLTAFFLFALANGLSGSIISNYFKDVFQVDSVQRGLLEIPRELPGVVGVFVIAALPSLGNVSLSVLGFALYCVGLLVLGLFSPGYFVMQLFVFTYSLGDHMVMPIRDAIAMDLADEGKTGTFPRTLPRHDDARLHAGLGACVRGLPRRLFLFPHRSHPLVLRRTGIPHSCARPSLPSAKNAARAGCAQAQRRAQETSRPPKVPALLHRHRRLRLPEADAPCLCSMGVIIELLSMGADTVALLGIAAYFCGGWVAPLIGKFLDRYGVQKGLALESAGVAGVFLFAAWAASGIVNGSLRGWGGMAAAFASYILIFLTDHFNSVHVMLMRELSESPADVMENLSFGLSVDHVLAVTVSGLLGAVWKYVGPQYVFLLGAAVCTVHLGVALWLKRQRRAAV